MAEAPDLMKYLPECFQKELLTAVIEVFAEAIGLYITNLDDLIQQLFVETATEGLDLWEEDYGLSSYVGKPDDQRRSRIKSKIRGVGTITISLIKNVSESYVYGTVDVIENAEEYSFTIKFIDIRGIPPNIEDLEAAIEEIKPAHLEVVYEYTYTTWEEVKTITWEEAATGTWGELKTRMVI